jgi:large subunit ribosomal protein L5
MNTPVLKDYYQKEIAPQLRKSRGYENPHQIPVVTKIVINSGLDASASKDDIAQLQKDITAIAGQKPVVTRAKVSISNFKVREGMPLGVKVTLRGSAMYYFLERLIAITLPGIRDFRGISRRLDGQGNYTLGITDHTIFPEIAGATSDRKNIGMDITIVTSALTDDEGRELLQLLGMPFRKQSSAA